MTFLVAVGAFAKAAVVHDVYAVPIVYTGISDTTDAINQWLPIIIEFAMLAMVLGLLKRVKF